MQLLKKFGKAETMILVIKKTREFTVNASRG